MAEFGDAQVGDARLSRRLVKLADRLGDAPSASIPGACNGHAETQGAYRLFDQARLDKRGLGWESVLAPHMARTEARMAEHPEWGTLIFDYEMPEVQSFLISSAM